MVQLLHNRTPLEQKRRTLRKNSTKAKRILWSKIKNSKLGHQFRRQHSIGPFIVDFYCPKLRLIIEVDGWVHWEGMQPHKNEKRQQYLEKFGFTVVRFTNDKVLDDTEGVLYNLQLICKQLSTPSACLSAVAPPRLRGRAQIHAPTHSSPPSLDKEGPVPVCGQAGEVESI